MRELNLMTIAGISESELAWSNIYSYFMDPRNEPKYASAFINALLELCSLEYSEMFPDDRYCVRTEVPTTNSESTHNSRIDILIEGKNSIIIENKINHVLNNPLEEYWNSAINPAALVVLTISRISGYELDAYCTKNVKVWNKIKCINITHYDLITKAKELIGKDFENPILRELEEIILQKTITMPDNFYIKNDSQRLEANRIYKQEANRRKMITKECMHIRAFEKLREDSIIEFKTCSNNEWLHFRYRGQNDLVIGVFCAYLWDWERYDKDRLRRVNSNESEIRPVITLYVQIHGKLYHELKRKNELKIEDTGYDEPGRYCHVMDYDVDMTEASEKYCRKGELAAFITEILNDTSKCKILETAEAIYKQYLSKHEPTYLWADALTYLKQMQANVGGEDFANWLVNQFRFILYDRTHQIVILAVKDQRTKDRFEKFINEDLMLALKYTFGDNVRCSIICQNIKPIGTDVAN